MTKQHRTQDELDQHELGQHAYLPEPDTICYERTFAHPPARVWQAITSEEELPQWFVPLPAHLDLRVGGQWSMDEPSPSDNPTFQGTIIDFQPGGRIEMTWREGPSSMWFEVEGADDAGTTHLLFGHRLDRDDAVDGRGGEAIGYGWDEQPCGPGTFQPGLAAAWHEHLERLRCYLDGAPVPAPGNVPREVVDRYRELIVRRGARVSN